jgi:hypothetical protein
MKHAARVRRLEPAAKSSPAADSIGAPLVWTFDGRFATCLADMEDTLRRVIVQLGDVAGVAVLIEVSLPALKRRVDDGESIQPAWGQFLERISDRYGLPSPPRVRHVRSATPLATLVIAYRS